MTERSERDESIPANEPGGKNETTWFRKPGDKQIFWILVFIGLAVRLAYLFEININASPDAFAALDQMENRYWAQSLLTGDLLGRYAAFPEDMFYRCAVFFKPPLYAYILAALLGVSGGSILFVQIVQVCLSAVTCGLTYRLARHSGMQIRISFIAGLILCFYGPHIFVSAQLLPTTVFVALCVWILLQSLRFRESATIFNALLIGVQVGMAALLRTNILIFLPFLALWLYRGISRKLALKKSLLLGAVTAIAFLACILPVTVRNATVGGDWVSISYYGGYNFYAANNTNSVYGNAGHNVQDYNDVVLRDSRLKGRRLTASEISLVGYAMGMEFIVTEPWRYLQVEMNKLYRVLNAYEMMSNQSIYAMTRFSRILNGLVWYRAPVGFPLGFLAPFSIVGFGFMIARKRELLGFGFVLSMVVGLLLFFITFRHRLPLVPVLAIAGSYGIFELWAVVKRKQRVRLFFAVLLFASFAVVNSNWDNFDTATELPVSEFRLRVSYWNQAASLYQSGQSDAAIQILQKSEDDRDYRATLAISYLHLMKSNHDRSDSIAALSQIEALRARFGPLEDIVFSQVVALSAVEDYGAAEKQLAFLREQKSQNEDRGINSLLEHCASALAAKRPCALVKRRFDLALRRRFAPRWELLLPPWSEINRSRMGLD